MRDFAEAIRAQRVPYIFDGDRIKAHALAQKAEKRLARRKWRSAERLVTSALQISPDCIAALLAAGRLQLMIQQIEKAKAYSPERQLLALGRMSERMGWISLEEGHLLWRSPLLTDHIQRNSSGLRGLQSLLKCFFLSDRYEAGNELAKRWMDEKVPNDCFRSNKYCAAC